MFENCKLCKIMSLGKINKYIILVFIAGLLQLGIFLYTSKIAIFGNSIDLYKNNIIQIQFYSLGLSLSIILFFIYKIINKSKKTKANSILSEQKSKFSFLQGSQKKESISKLKNFLWILLLSVIDFSSNISEIFTYATSISDPSPWLLNFVIMSFYYKFIFKQRLYKHHYLVIIFCSIIFVGLLIYYIILYSEDIKDSKSLFLLFFFNYLTTTLRCLTYIIYKYFSMKTILSYYEILFFQGIIEFALASILITILIQSEVIYSFSIYWKYIQKNLSNYLLFIFFNFGYYSLVFIICGIFSPFYIFLVIFIFYIAYFILAIISYIIQNNYTRQNNYALSLIMVITFVLIFLVLVFTEIIELNCFGLSYNTKKKIELRARLDSELNTNEDDENNIDKKILLKEGYSINLEDNLYMEMKNIDEIIPIEIED